MSLVHFLWVGYFDAEALRSHRFVVRSAIPAKTFSNLLGVDVSEYYRPEGYLVLPWLGLTVPINKTSISWALLCKRKLGCDVGDIRHMELFSEASLEKSLSLDIKSLLSRDGGHPEG